jgi:trk system potassium uptake protein
MKVVILGCGRSGAARGKQLASLGHDVTLIERNAEALRRLGKNPSVTIVVGDGLNDDILVKAGVPDADAFLAMTRGDNTNLMAAQVVQRRYNVPTVIVKVADPMRAEAYRKLGLFVVNPSALIAGICRDYLTGAEFLPIDHYNSMPAEGQV